MSEVRIASGRSGRVQHSTTGDAGEELDRLADRYGSNVLLEFDPSKRVVRGYVRVLRQSPEQFYAEYRYERSDAPLESFKDEVTSEIDAAGWGLDSGSGSNQDVFDAIGTVGPSGPTDIGDDVVREHLSHGWQTDFAVPDGESAVALVEYLRGVEGVGDRYTYVVSRGSVPDWIDADIAIEIRGSVSAIRAGEAVHKQLEYEEVEDAKGDVRSALAALTDREERRSILADRVNTAGLAEATDMRLKLEGSDVRWESFQRSSVASALVALLLGFPLAVYLAQDPLARSLTTVVELSGIVLPLARLLGLETSYPVGVLLGASVVAVAVSAALIPPVRTGVAKAVTMTGYLLGKTKQRIAGSPEAASTPEAKNFVAALAALSERTRASRYLYSDDAFVEQAEEVLRDRGFELSESSELARRQTLGAVAGVTGSVLVVGTMYYFGIQFLESFFALLSTRLGVLVVVSVATTATLFTVGWVTLSLVVRLSSRLLSASDSVRRLFRGRRASKSSESLEDVHGRSRGASGNAGAAARNSTSSQPDAGADGSRRAGSRDDASASNPQNTTDQVSNQFNEGNWGQIEEIEEAHETKSPEETPPASRTAHTGQSDGADEGTDATESGSGATTEAASTGRSDTSTGSDSDGLDWGDDVGSGGDSAVESQSEVGTDATGSGNAADEPNGAESGRDSRARDGSASEDRIAGSDSATGAATGPDDAHRRARVDNRNSGFVQNESPITERPAVTERGVDGDVLGVVAAGDAVYVATADGRVSTFGPAGNQKSDTEVCDRITAPPTFANGSLYVPAGDELRVFDSGVAATISLDSPCRGAPVVVGGDVLVADADGTLYRYAPDGRRRWTHDTGTRATRGGLEIRGSLAVGNVLAYTTPNAVEAYPFDDDGRLSTENPRFTKGLDAEPAGSPVLSPEGNLYVCDQQKRVQRMSGAGNGWTERVAEPQFGPALDETTVYAAGTNLLVALDAADGRSQWRTELPDTPRCPPVVSGRTLYLGDDSGLVHAYHTKDGSRRWSVDVGAVRGEPVVTPSGLVVPTERGVAFLTPP